MLLAMLSDDGDVPVDVLNGMVKGRQLGRPLA